MVCFGRDLKLTLFQTHLQLCDLTGYLRHKEKRGGLQLGCPDWDPMALGDNRQHRPGNLRDTTWL